MSRSYFKFSLRQHARLVGFADDLRKAVQFNQLFPQLTVKLRLLFEELLRTILQHVPQLALVALCLQRAPREIEAAADHIHLRRI